MADGNKIGKIHLTSGGMEQLLRERDQMTQEHLDQMNKAQAVKGSAVNAVVLAAVQYGGLPVAGTEQAFFDRANTLAKIISDNQLVTRAQEIKALLKELKIYQARDAIVWSCKQAGVELFDGGPRDSDLETAAKVIADVTADGTTNDLGVEKKPIIVSH